MQLASSRTPRFEDRQGRLTDEEDRDETLRE